MLGNLLVCVFVMDLKTILPQAGSILTKAINKFLTFKMIQVLYTLAQALYGLYWGNISLGLDSTNEAQLSLCKTPEQLD